MMSTISVGSAASAATFEIINGKPPTSATHRRVRQILYIAAPLDRLEEDRLPLPRLPAIIQEKSRLALLKRRHRPWPWITLTVVRPPVPPFATPRLAEILRCARPLASFRSRCSALLPSRRRTPSPKARR